MSILLQHLRDPEYMHVLLNPIPVYGLAFGTLALVLALLLRNKRVTIAALVLVFLAGISAWPVYQYGESAYDRVKSMSDDAGEKWLDEHMARGEKLIWMFYVLAGVSAAGVVVTLKWPQRSTAVSVIALALSSVTLGMGSYIAYAGGHVRHREFRFEPPPTPQVAEHHHGEKPHAAEAHKPETEQITAPTSQKPMEHAGHEAMQSPGQQPMEHGEHGPMQSLGEKPMSEQERKQLEASRLQLEASQKQLEASRKQLEATGAASLSASPGASPSTQPSPDHKHDEHQHDEPKP
jgi:hypothetical protein